MSTFVISTDEAKQDKLFYVVANVIIVNKSKKTCLLLKRGENEKVLPGKWGFPGGKLEHEDVKKLIIESNLEPIVGIDNILGKVAAREAKEECNLDVSEDGRLIKNKVFIGPDGIPVFMATVANYYTGGEVITEGGAISDYAWVKKEDFSKYDCISGIPEEATEALDGLGRL